MNENEIWKQSLHVWETGAKALEKLAKTMDKTSLANCVEAIAKCKGRIITSGAGTSKIAAEKIAHSFSCVERSSFFLSPVEAAHGSLGSVQSDDVVILISKGGKTSEITNLIPALKAKKVFIISVTENENSILAKNSDIVLKVVIDREADKFNMMATTSTLAVIAVFDGIAMSLMSRSGFTKKQFSIIHPGGEVGEKLSQEFKDK